jgi:membrane AbrB-like protein
MTFFERFKSRIQSWPDWLQRTLRLAATLLCAYAGGSIASHIHMPLPWLLGAMLGVAVISLAGGVHRQPVLARKSAQIYIGATIGLYFTPAVLALLSGLALWMVLGAFIGIAMSALSARLLQRLAHVDGPTAIYSVSLGASAEMSVQAQRAGADGAVVASAQAVRIMLVTSTASYIAWASGADPVMPQAGIGVLSLWISVGLLLAATATGWAFNKLHMPNAWVLGALLIGAICANHDITGRLPDLGLIIAQLIIGWGLGQNITREFFSRAPRTLASVALVTIIILAVCLGSAVFIAKGADLSVMTAFISMAPGGMTEMGLISKAFGLGAPVVTAFHLTRILTTIFLTKPMARKMLDSGWISRTAHR